jgi:hypothetical protein
MKRFQSFAGWYVPLRELQWITLNFDQGMEFLIKQECCVSLVGKHEAPTRVATPPPRKGGGGSETLSRTSRRVISATTK